MLSDTRFYARAMRLKGEYDKLVKSRDEGTINEERYTKRRERLDAKLLKLRDRNLILIDERLHEIDESIEELGRKKAEKLMEEDEHHRLTRQLTLEKRELEAELDMLGLLDANEYAQHLGRQAKAEEVDRRYGWTLTTDLKQALQRGKDGYRIPLYAWGIFCLLFVVAFIQALGESAGDPANVLMQPALAVASALIGTVLLYVSTLIVGVESATFKRAFTALMLSIPLMLAANIAVGYLMVYIPDDPIILLVALSLSYLGVYVYCVKTVFDTSPIRAAAAAIANIVIYGFIYSVVYGIPNMFF